MSLTQNYYCDRCSGPLKSVTNPSPSPGPGTWFLEHESADCIVRTLQDLSGKVVDISNKIDSVARAVNDLGNIIQNKG